MRYSPKAIARRHHETRDVPHRSVIIDKPRADYKE